MYCIISNLFYFLVSVHMRPYGIWKLAWLPGNLNTNNIYLLFVITIHEWRESCLLPFFPSLISTWVQKMKCYFISSHYHSWENMVSQFAYVYEQVTDQISRGWFVSGVLYIKDVGWISEISFVCFICGNFYNPVNCTRLELHNSTFTHIYIYPS